MAIAIKSIPTLTEETAKKFIDKAESNTKNKGSIDFKKQIVAASKIIQKSAMK